MVVHTPLPQLPLLELHMLVLTVLLEQELTVLLEVTDLLEVMDSLELMDLLEVMDSGLPMESSLPQLPLPPLIKKSNQIKPNTIL
jgi:hypothetical protein